MCKKHICGTYNCPTDALCAICCHLLAARPHDLKSSPAQFVLLISHSIQNVMQCKELFDYNVAYVVCQYAVTKRSKNPKGALLYMVCDHVSCALRGPARTSESPGRLRRYAPYKGLHPLRRFAAIPVPSPKVKRRDRSHAVP